MGLYEPIKIYEGLRGAVRRIATWLAVGGTHGDQPNESRPQRGRTELLQLPASRTPRKRCNVWPAADHRLAKSAPAHTNHCSRSISFRIPVFRNLLLCTPRSQPRDPKSENQDPKFPISHSALRIPNWVTGTCWHLRTLQDAPGEYEN